MMYLSLFAAFLGLCVGATPDPARPSARGGVVAMSDCIPDGGTGTLCTQKKLPDDWSLSASAEENDTFSDDPLGEPTITSHGDGLFTICITITNDGGDLSGPNGVVQNGLGEGDCIEVDLEVTTTNPASGGYTIPIIGGGRNASTAVKQTTTHSKEFCPC